MLVKGVQTTMHNLYHKHFCTFFFIQLFMSSYLFLYAALTALSLQEGRQWAAVCFTVNSDLPSVIKQWKIIQVDDCWDSNRTFMRGILYALKYFLLCLSTAIELKNRDWITRVRAENSLSFEPTRLINWMKPEQKQQDRPIYPFMFLRWCKLEMVKIFQILSFRYVLSITPLSIRIKLWELQYR